MATRTTGGHRARDDAQAGAAKAEHTAAYALAAVAVILTAIGLLRGFGVLGDDAAADVGTAGTQDPGFGAIWDSVVWLLPAASAALLAFALHRNDHHWGRAPEGLRDAEEGGWKGEHAAAYAMALAAVVFGALGLLTGFDVFDRGNDQPDAVPWLLASLVAALLANALHSVRHHQAVPSMVIDRAVAADWGDATRTTVRQQMNLPTRR